MLLVGLAVGEGMPLEGVAQHLDAPGNVEPVQRGC
jgi:hypothetical protein